VPGVPNEQADSQPERTEPPDRRLARLAGRQHGVVSLGQLREIGLGLGQIRYRRKLGRLHLLHRGVYAVGHAEVTLWGRFLGAVLAVGADAMVSHRSAAVLWRLLRPEPAPVDVTTARRARVRPGIRTHEAAGLEARRHEGIPVTTVSRTLLDCAAVLDDTLLRRAVHQAEQQRLVTPRSLATEIAGSPGHQGAGRLAALIADGPTPTKSELEDMLLDLIKRHGLPRPTHINTKLGRDEVDLFYPDENLVVEADSRTYHEFMAAARADRAKDARLEAAGHRVLRVHHEQATGDEDQTAERLRRALNT
jgi:very-short-patch-repair endonuclease